MRLLTFSGVTTPFGERMRAALEAKKVTPYAVQQRGGPTEGHISNVIKG